MTKVKRKVVTCVWSDAGYLIEPTLSDPVFGQIYNEMMADQDWNFLSGLVYDQIYEDLRNE